MRGPAPADDPGLYRVLAALGVAPAGLLGGGGEAWVYALGPDRVVRVLHGEGPHDLGPRLRLVDELRRGGAPVPLPEVLEQGEVGSRHYVIERRLPGRSVADELVALGRRDRDRLIEAHLDMAASLGDLRLDHRPWFGDLIAPDPVRAPTWRRYLVERATRSLDAVAGFEAVEPDELARGLPDCDDGAFVHLDAFAGNMLAVGPAITAVIDIGQTSLVGDRRLDPLTAAVYLCAPPITPQADEADRRTARAWLRDAGLDQWFEPARRWVAGYWAWAVDDRNLHRWCRSVLT